MDIGVLERAARELEQEAADLLAAADQVRAIAGRERAATMRPPRPAKTRQKRSALPAESVPRPPVNLKADGTILELIGAGKGLTATEIATATKASVSCAYSRLQRMVRDGALVVGGDKKYRRPVGQSVSAN